MYFPGLNSKNLVFKFGLYIDGPGRRSYKLNSLIFSEKHFFVSYPKYFANFDFPLHELPFRFEAKGDLFSIIIDREKNGTSFFCRDSKSQSPLFPVNNTKTDYGM